MSSQADVQQDKLTESQASEARDSKTIQEGVLPLPEYQVPTLSQAENSSKELRESTAC